MCAKNEKSDLTFYFLYQVKLSCFNSFFCFLNEIDVLKNSFLSSDCIPTLVFRKIFLKV